MTTEVINIQIREDGSRVVARNIEGIGKAADRTVSPLSGLKSLLAGLVSAAAVAQVARYADEYTNLQNRLRLVTTSTANLKKVTSELLSISNQTRSDFTATGELYARLASSTKELGLSQRQLLNFTKQVNQAIVLSGASAQEAAGGLRQLAQGLASGVLRGDELNSVMENFPKVAQIIAEGMGKSVGQIRALGAEGKITADIIIDAFDKAGASLDADFGKTVPTLSQAFTVLKNNFVSFIGRMNEASGITATISGLLLGLANNLDVILPILTAVGAAVAAAFVPALIARFAAALKALWVLVAANPFTALLAVIAGVTAAVYGMRDSIKLGIDDTTTLGDLMRSIWENLTGVVRSVANAITDVLKSSAPGWSRTVEGSVKKQESLWIRVPRTVLQVFDAIGFIIRGTMQAVAAVVMKVIDNIIDNFKLLGSAVQDAMSGDFAGMAAKLANNKSAFADVGAAWGEAMAGAAQDQMSGGLEAWLDKRLARAQEIAKARTAETDGELGGGGGGGSPAGTGKGAKTKKDNSLDQLKSALRGVLDQASPVEAAQRQLADAQKVLNDARAQGLITKEQAAKAEEQLMFIMRAELDPLKALNEQIDESTTLLGMSNEQRQIEQQMLEYGRQLKEQGLVVGQEELDQLRAKLTVEQELARIAAVRDQLEQETIGAQQRNIADMMTAYEQLKETTSTDDFNFMNRLLGGSLDETQAAFDASMEQFQSYYGIVDQLRQRDLISEQQASEAKKALHAQEMDMRVSQVQTGLTAISGLMSSHNKTAFRIGQAAAIANATITGIQMAMNAYESASKIPYVGWILGPLAAAGAAAAAAAQVSQIRSQQPPAYRTGGTYTIGGHGGTDSQTVALRGTPGEQISINTPHQANAMARVERMMMEDRRRGGNGDVHLGGITVVQTGRPDNKTPEQNARQMRRAAESMLEAR